MANRDTDAVNQNPCFELDGSHVELFELDPKLVVGVAVADMCWRNYVPKIPRHS